MEGQTFVGSAYNSDGNFAALQTSLDSDVLMDCLPAQDSSTFSKSRVVARPLASGQGLEDEKIKLRKYQKELSRPGIEGHNQIICAPTGSGKTYTAGYICQQQRLRAEKEGRRFKAIFIVCIRNLITQQSDALRDIIGKDIVQGADDKLSLATCSEYFDVVVATAQLLVNELRSGHMQITDLDLLIMDECHHTDLCHPYATIMEAYYAARHHDSRARLPQIIGLTASLGVGSDDAAPAEHYVRICANLDCSLITHVKENCEELERYVPCTLR